jgi:hypothetical protein
MMARAAYSASEIVATPADGYISGSCSGAAGKHEQRHCSLVESRLLRLLAFL